jgi:hydroxymethylbilane synthase
MSRKVVAGTRGSQLALIQTRQVAARIQEINPGLEVKITKIATSGDRDQKTRLERMDVAVFVKELEQALLEGRIDLAVHSLKDVPTDLPSGLQLLAVLEREDPRDALAAKSRISELRAGARIGTGSLRRSIQLKRLRPDLEVCPIRGNMDTRLKKVSTGEVDGVIVAAAAMARLGWQERICEYFSVEQFLPEAGQGAVVVESRTEDKEVIDLVSPINHLVTWQRVMSERAFLKTLGGGCRAPIAALGTVSGGYLKLEGMIASRNGAKILQAADEGPLMEAEAIGVRLAGRMLEMGAREFIDEAQNQ